MKKVLHMVLPLLFLSGLLAVAACDRQPIPSAATAPSQPELGQLLLDATKAAKNSVSYKYDLDIDISLDLTGGGTSGRTNMKTTSHGATSVSTGEMELTVDMVLGGNAVRMENASQNVSLGIYILADWMYLMIDMPYVGKQWVKTAVTDAIRDRYDPDVIGIQVAALESPATIASLPDDRINGVACYVLEVRPDLAKIIPWLSQQPSINNDINLNRLTSLPDTFKELTFTAWIAKDTRLLQKLQGDMFIEASAAQLGAAATDFEKMALDIALTILMKEYNQLVSISLPAEASGAMELAPEALLSP